MTGRSRRKRLASALRVLAEDFPNVPGQVLFTAGAIRGTGTLLDISTEGASIYRPSKTVPAGIVVDLHFIQSGTERRLRAEAEVVERNDDGFSVRFLQIERELETLVLAAADEAEAQAEEGQG